MRYKTAIADAKSSIPTTPARTGSDWWAVFGSERFVEWQEIPSGREPFAPRALNMGSTVSTAEVEGTEFECAVWSLLRGS